MKESTRLKNGVFLRIDKYYVYKCPNCGHVMKIGEDVWGDNHSNQCRGCRRYFCIDKDYRRNPDRRVGRAEDPLWEKS